MHGAFHYSIAPLLHHSVGFRHCGQVGEPGVYSFSAITQVLRPAEKASGQSRKEVIATHAVKLAGAQAAVLKKLRDGQGAMWNYSLRRLLYH